ncbi:hypothetical protein GMST_20310 [Geomonas silvestris]|uniref:DUF5667 domain-containing protein n=1 Tax=Geomonas silvestris TaxID=2740184 RepID=A0A6V8MIC7_9BACT|nr:hypothetical protein [Geomonas silvestris]GFO59706.1 hypothetical protein GMST_20310 [Geomonas silvestris]
MFKMTLAFLAGAALLMATLPAAGQGPGPAQAPAPQGAGRQPMAQHAGLMRAMMHNPKHLLAMGYHKNLVGFARALERVARQGDTVPRDFARTAVTEMRRSADQMEIYHEEAARDLPAELKAQHAAMAKMMADHLTQMRGELAQLEAVTKADRIDSRQVLAHLDPLFKWCAQMSDGACREGGRFWGGSRHGRQQKGGAPGCGCPESCRGECNCQGCRDCGGADGPRMSQKHRQMVEAFKKQDVEISRLVDQLNRAPKEAQQAIMVDILTRIVRQHEALAPHLTGTAQGQRLGEAAGSPTLTVPDQEDLDGGDDDYGMENEDLNPGDPDPDDLQQDEGMEQPDLPPH